MTAERIVIIGGNGKVCVHLPEWTHVMYEYLSTQVALRLARLLTADGRKVDSVIRNADQSQGIKDVGANPVILSLEDNSVDDFVPHLEVADVVVFAAGAGRVVSARAISSISGPTEVLYRVVRLAQRPSITKGH